MNNRQAWDRYEKWREGQIPTKVPESDVVSVLEEFFPGKYEPGSKEPHVVKHPAVLDLKRFNGFPPAIPNDHHGMVKRPYVDNLVLMVCFIRVWRHYCSDKGWDERSSDPEVLRARATIAAGVEQQHNMGVHLDGNLGED